MNRRLTAHKLAAIVRRDWLDFLRHRAAVAVQAGTTAAQLAGFYFFARAVGPHYHPDGMDYYPFLLVGTAVFTFYVSGISSFVSGLKEAQVSGALEIVMGSATPAPLVVALSALSIFSARVLRLLLFLFVGAIPFLHAFTPNWGAAALAILFSTLAAVGIAMLAASAQVLLQLGDSVIWIFGSAGWLFTGMAFPLSAIPGGLRWLAPLLPPTLSIQALRAALLQGGEWGPAARPLLLLALAAALLLPLSAAVLARVVRRARMDGTLSFY